jgi:hypothetical protein
MGAWTPEREACAMTYAAPHLYIDSDVAADETLVEWRRRRHTPRPRRLRRLMVREART